MFPDIKPGTTNNTTGWICAICGTWVSVNSYHACGGSPTVEDFPIEPITLDFTSGTPLVDIELHQKLDNIEELLGRIVRKIGA